MTSAVIQASILQQASCTGGNRNERKNSINRSNSTTKQIIVVVIVLQVITGKIYDSRP